MFIFRVNNGNATRFKGDYCARHVGWFPARLVAVIGLTVRLRGLKPDQTNMRASVIASVWTGCADSIENLLECQVFQRYNLNERPRFLLNPIYRLGFKRVFFEFE